jgi:predicted DsbA family dithiol-disulfide isomerase
MVARDMALAARLGVRGTPTFVIGYRRTDDQFQPTKVLTGARPVAEFEEALDDAIRLRPSDRADAGFGSNRTLAVEEARRVRQ